MKGKLSLKKTYSNKQIKKSTSSFILNSIIVLLSAIIIFISYSLYSNLSTRNSNDFALRKKSNSSQIQVEVLNGCGVSGVADTLTDYLRNHNFDVVQIGNYISYDVEKSIVIDRTGNMINAFKVADTLGIDHKNVIQQMNSNYFLDVSLIIGKDFNNLKPFK